MTAYVLSSTAGHSRLEGQITIPASTTATVGAGTATITAGTYYPTSLMAEVATQFATASGTTCAVTMGWGRIGTGLVTLTFGVTKAISWVSTDLRDLLGFAANLTTNTVHVSTKHARNVWLPNCHYQAANVVDATFRGLREADIRYWENAAGYGGALMGQEKEVGWLRWPAAFRSKTFTANEATANESFERFARDAIWGVAAWGTPSGPIRFYPDADASTYAQYRVQGMTEFKPIPYYENWVGGPHTIALDRLVVVPGT